MGRFERPARSSVHHVEDQRPCGRCRDLGRCLESQAAG